MKESVTIKELATPETSQGYVLNSNVLKLLQIAISPDQRFIVSVGNEGAIFIWHTPDKVQQSMADADMPHRQ